jgi:predicted metalloprotease with PDZ domain
MASVIPPNHSTKFVVEQRDEQLLGTQAAIRYHWYFEQAAQHIIRIVMEVDVSSSQETVVLGLPVWIPGSYKVRDYISALGSFLVYNEARTPLEWSWISKNRLQVQPVGSRIVIEYAYYAFERDSTIRSSHVTRNHAFINPVTCCLYVEGREHELHHVYLHHDRSVSGWQKVSTQLSPVQPSTADNEPLVLGALNYDLLVDSPVEIGNHYTASFEYADEHGTAIIETAIVGRGNYEAEWITKRIETIVRVEAALWGGLPFDRYVFIIHVFPGTRSGGLEHTRSSVNAMEGSFSATGAQAWSDTKKIQSLLSLLCHEFFHVWNIKRIRPRELGPFDYNAENLTTMLWLVEGATSYYDDLLTYRCGFYTREEYFKVLSKDHLTKFFRQPGRHHASIKDNSIQAWVKLYLPHDDSVNRNVSYYLHGALIFMLLDFWIITQSGGAKKLDDGFRALWKVYQQRPEVGITEDEFIAVVEQATGVPVQQRLNEWLNLGHATHDTSQELPFSELLTAMGLEWKTAPAQEPPLVGEQIPPMQLLVQPPSVNARSKPFIGCSLKVEQGKVVITQVEDGTPASIAGLAVDDEIIAVNGVRVSSIEEVEFYLARCGMNVPSELTIASDTTVLTTHVTPVAVDEYMLAVSEAASEEQLRYIEFWLQR